PVMPSGEHNVSKGIPIREFIDHGPNVQSGAGADWERDVYPKLYGQAKHTIAKAGDRIALKGVDWRIVSSAGEMISPTTLPGAKKPNPECAKFQTFDNNMEDRCRWRATSPSTASTPRIWVI